MSPIPGEPLDPKPKELTTSDGRKFKVKIPGSRRHRNRGRPRSGAARSRPAMILGHSSTPTTSVPNLAAAHLAAARV